MATQNRMPSDPRNQESGSQGGSSQGSKSQGSKGGVMEHASNALSEAKDAGLALASKAGEAVSNAATAVKEGAANLGSKVVEGTDNAIHATGKGMENLAQGIRARAPSEGILGNAAGKVADTLESGGKYLEEHGMGDMVNDLTEIIRRNPIPAVLVGVGIGFVLARATSRG